MNKLANVFLLIGLLMGATSLEAQLTKKKYKIQLCDNDGNSVGFFLMGNKGTQLKSNMDGQVLLSKYQLNKYKNERFTLHFSNHLAYMVYRINPYFEKGNTIKDKHLKYNQLSLEKLCHEMENTFYLRRKEIRLDDRG